ACLRVAPPAGAYLQAVPEPGAQPVLPGAAPEQGPPAADADQQVDHPDRSVLRFLLRAALLQRLSQLLWRHPARGPQPAAQCRPLRAGLGGGAWLSPLLIQVTPAAAVVG